MDSDEFLQRRRCVFQIWARRASSSISDSTKRVLNRSAAVINVNQRRRSYFGRFATTLHFRLFQRNRGQQTKDMVLWKPDREGRLFDCPWNGHLSR
jgi:hypothetical protein